MTTFATVQNLLQRLTEAIPMAWQEDRLFRGAAIGVGVTGAVLLLRLSGPPAPDRPGQATPVVPAGVLALPDQAGAPARSSPVKTPQIAPGRSLNDVTVAPSLDTDRFGTFKPGNRP